MTFYPPAHNSRNISSVGYGGGSTKDVIYITDPYNASTLTMKAFISSISYDMGKQIKEEQSVIQNFYSFASYEGNFAIKISIDVPAASASEAKNNLAKISHLQTSIMPGRTAGKRTGNLQQHLIVYMSNLINCGAIPDTNEFVPESLSDMKKFGLYCWVTEVTYEPDFSQGSLSTSEGLFPKFYKVDLTLNPDTSYYSAKTSRKFLQPFNQNGHYNNGDSMFFPFLVPVGSKSIESSAVQDVAAINTMLSMDIMNDRTLRKTKDTVVYLSLPIDKPTANLDTLKGTDTLNRPVSTDITKFVRRELVFKPFIESFSRKVATKVTVEVDAGTSLSQKIKGYQSFVPIEYSVAFSVPAENVTEAKYNAAKMQYLMRMFFTRQGLGLTTSEKLLYSLKVFIPSYIGKTTSVPTTREEAYKNAFVLQLVNITLDIDVSAGFFRSGLMMYPKSYKITMSLKDTHYSNQRKIQLKTDSKALFIGGVLEGGTRTIDDTTKKEVIVGTEIPKSPLSNIKDLTSTGYLNNNIVYWKPGEQ
jgi:hypothetical protein